MTNDLEDRLSRETITAAIEEAEFQLQPADPGELIAAVDSLLAYSRMFNIPTDAPSASGFYRHGLAGLPRRALTEGLPKVLGEWTDSFRLPTPGVIKEKTGDMVIVWTSQMNALKVVRKLMGTRQVEFSTERRDDEATPEYLAETKAIFDKTMADLKARSKAFGR